LPPPALLLELDVVVDGIAAGVAVTVGSFTPPVMTGGSLPPPALLLELDAVAGGIAAGVAVTVGSLTPPVTTGGSLPPPALLLELVAFVPPDWELMAEAEVAIVPVGIGFAVTGELGSGFFSAGFRLPCGFFVAGFMTRAVWPLVFSRASAGVLCSAVVTSMAAPSAQAADVVKSLRSFIDMLLSVPGRGAIRRH
jgi:hypothetical protein